jgi:PAS domain S-box-containing protein
MSDEEVQLMSQSEAGMKLEGRERLLAELNAAIMSVADGVLVCDTEGIILRANPYAAELFSHSRTGRRRRLVDRIAMMAPKTLGGKPLSPDEIPISRALRGENVQNFSMVVYPLNRRTLWLSMGASPLRDAEGKLVGGVCTIRDVTDHKLAGDALRESEHRYHLLFESLSEAFALHEIICDPRGTPRDYRYLDVNPAFERMTGLNREEILGKTVLEVIPDLEPRWIEIYGKVALTGEPVRFEDYAQHFRKYFEVIAFSPERGRFAALFEDVTDRKAAEADLKKANRALRTISECNQALVRATTESTLLNEITRIAVEIGGYRMAWVGIAQHDDDKTVRPVAWAGHEAGFLEGVKITWADTPGDHSAAGMAIRTGKPCLIGDVLAEQTADGLIEEKARREYASSIALPLMGPGGPFGALSLYSFERSTFDEEEVGLLTELSTDLAYGIFALRSEAERKIGEEALRDSFQRLRTAIKGTIQAMAAASEMRDPYTAGHQRQVASLAAAISAEMGLAEEEIEGVRMAGEIHDIGKISVPAEILSKPGKLNDLEFSLIKRHPTSGYEILRGVEFPWPIADMVLQHHERMNGSGYPSGLTGDEIIQGARILAVADVVETMASHRPYRPALGIDTALAHVASEKGILYDPEAVDACLRLFGEKGYRLGE